MIHKKTILFSGFCVFVYTAINAQINRQDSLDRAPFAGKWESTELNRIRFLQDGTFIMTKAGINIAKGEWKVKNEKEAELTSIIVLYPEQKKHKTSLAVRFINPQEIELNIEGDVMKYVKTRPE